MRGMGPQLSASNPYHDRERVAKQANVRAKACADLDLRLSGKEVDDLPMKNKMTRAKACAKLDRRLERKISSGGGVVE